MENHLGDHQEEEHNIEEHIKKHVRVYISVFVALMALTLITVAASYLDLSLGKTVALALFIATIKASLVACYFMHLISEKKLIFLVLGFAGIFIIGLVGLLLLAKYDTVRL